MERKKGNKNKNKPAAKGEPDQDDAVLEQAIQDNKLAAATDPVVNSNAQTTIGGDKAQDQDKEKNKKKKRKNKKKRDEDGFTLRVHKTRNEWYRFTADNTYHEIIFSTADEVADHPWSHLINAKYCLAADGVVGDPIFLTTGRRYCFTLVHEANCQLILTSDPRGGDKAQKVPTSYLLKPGSSLIFRVTPDFPSILYYQDDKYMFLGGLVVHEGDQDSHCDTCSATNSEELRSGDILTNFN